MILYLQLLGSPYYLKRIFYFRQYGNGEDPHSDIPRERYSERFVSGHERQLHESYTDGRDFLLNLRTYETIAPTRHRHESILRHAVTR